jgi:hypothetical protein
LAILEDAGSVRISPIPYLLMGKIGTRYEPREYFLRIAWRPLYPDRPPLRRRVWLPSIICRRQLNTDAQTGCGSLKRFVEFFCKLVTLRSFKIRHCIRRCRGFLIPSIPYANERIVSTLVGPFTFFAARGVCDNGLFYLWGKMRYRILTASREHGPGGGIGDSFLLRGVELLAAPNKRVDP